MESHEITPGGGPVGPHDMGPTPAPAAPVRKTHLWPALGLGAHAAVVLILGAIILFTFANSLHNTGFALDNKFIILEDPRLREAKRENLALIFTQDYWWPKAVSGLYRPLTTTTYLFNYALLGNRDNATGYHWVNFLLHWAVAVLVYFFILVLMEKLWPAFFTAAIFAVHPIVTESVTNIIGRADLLAALAVLGGFLLYVKSTTRAGWAKLPWLVALAVVTLLGGLAKESAVVVLGVMLLYDFTYRLYPRRPHWLANLAANFGRYFTTGYVAVLVPVLGLWWVRRLVFANLRPPELPWVDNPLTWDGNPLFAGKSVLEWFIISRLTAIKVMGKYFWRLVWPQELSCDYSYNEIPLVNLSFTSWEDWKALIALVVVIWLLVVAWRNYRKHAVLFFLIAFWFVTFLPVSNLLEVPTALTGSLPRPGTIMAERFMYLPLVGYAGWLVLTVYAVCRRVVSKLDVTGWTQRIWLQVTARTLLVLLVAGLGVRTFFRNFDWESDEKLWSSAVKVCPNSFKTHKSLAYALYENDPEFKNIDRIIAAGERALEITDKTQIVLLHLGAYYRIKGDTLAQRTADGTLVPTAASVPWYEKSVAVLEKAVPLDREFNADNRRKELQRGRAPETIVDIGNHEIYWNLGLSYMRLAQYQKALDAYAYMRHLAPTNPDAYLSLASVFISAGRLEEAAICLLQALLLDSNRQEAMRLVSDIYRQLDRDGCAVFYDQSQPRLNADCAIVRNHICAAYYGLTQVLQAARQFALARQTKKAALTTYNCPREAFDQLLPDQPMLSLRP